MMDDDKIKELVRIQLGSDEFEDIMFKALQPFIKEKQNEVFLISTPPGNKDGFYYQMFEGPKRFARVEPESHFVFDWH